MSASLLIKKAAAEGVSVKLESDNKLKACGPAEARAKWLPILREHKSELLAELATSDRQDRKTATPPRWGKLADLRRRIGRNLPRRPPRLCGSDLRADGRRARAASRLVCAARRRLARWPADNPQHRSRRNRRHRLQEMEVGTMTRIRLPNRRARETIGFEFRGLPLPRPLSRFADGRLAEIFIDAAKPSNDTRVAMRRTRRSP